MNPDRNFWHGRHVFLTGHTGFKGAWAVALLHELGAKVTGFSLPGVVSTPDLFHAAHLEAFCTDLRGDVRDAAALSQAIAQAKPDIVIHMAAQPIVRLGIREPIETLDVNILGAAKLLQAVRGAPGVNVCAIVTSDKCYENRERLWAYREDEAMGGKDPYSASKGAAELITSSFARTYFADGATRVVSLRAGNVIGGGDWAADRLVPDLIRAIRDNAVVDIRSPNSVRPWQHVFDLLCGYLVAIEHVATRREQPAFDAWNFGPNPGEELTVRCVVETVQNLWQGMPVVQFAHANDGAAKREEAGLLRVDNTKAKAELGWALRWNNTEAIAASVEWYKAVLHGADARDVTLSQMRAVMAQWPDAAQTQR